MGVALASGCRRDDPDLEASLPESAVAERAAAEAKARAQAEARLYRSEVAGFVVEFPDLKAPEVEDKELPAGAGKLRMHKVQYGSSAFMVTATRLGESVQRTDDEILQGARDGLVESTGSSVDQETPVDVGGTRGLELVLTATTSGIVMRQRARIVVVDRRVLTALSVAPEWTGSTTNEQRFFETFAPTTIDSRTGSDASD